MNEKEENGQVMEQGVFLLFPIALEQSNPTKECGSLMALF